MAALAPLLRLDDTYTSDEGAYAIQVRDLRDGHWEYRYAAERYDPDGRWFPLANSTASAKGWFAYVQHPAYPLLLVAATYVAGPVVGMHLAGLLGALGLAVAAWLLAAELTAEPWARRAAFWLAATGPVAIHAYILWAHAPSAAVAGLTLVAAVRFAKGARPLPLVCMAAGSAAGVLLRSEGLLFAIALAGGMFLVGLRGRPWGQRAGIPALCLAAATGAAVAENRWIGAIIGGNAPIPAARDRLASPPGTPDPGGGPMDWIGGRIEGAFHTLLGGADFGQREAALVVAALTMVTYAAWCHRRRRPGWERDVTVGLVAAAALYVARILSSRAEAMTGLFAAWPLVLLGVVVLPRSMPKATQLLVAVLALFALAVLATQYRVGGGLEWGGRFLSPVLAPLAVVACFGLRSFVNSLPAQTDARRRAVLGALAVLTLLPTLSGVVLLRNQRSLEGRLVDEVATGRHQLVITDAVALPRSAWRTYPEVGWMLVQEPGELREVVALVRSGGARHVTALIPASTSRSATAAFPTVTDVTGPVARKLGRRTLDLSAP